MVDYYTLYRGKCKEFCDKAIIKDPTLTLVRGHYYCPIWNSLEQHWWTIRSDGSIYDPTKLQFPSSGLGEYIPFSGIYECSQCGKELKEEEAQFDSNYVFCSYACHGRFVGL